MQKNDDATEKGKASTVEALPIIWFDALNIKCGPIYQPGLE